MVEPAKNNVITVKLNGTTVKLNTETLKGISVDKSSPLFLRKADRGDAGVISDKDAAKMMELLNKIAKNGTISAKDFEKAKLGDKNDFNKMIAATTKKVETSTVKNKDNSTTRTERHEDGSITKITTSVDGKVTQNYDANGKLTSKVSVNSEGSTASKYKYDENGNLTSVNTVNRTPQKKIKNQVNSTFKYDEAGNRIGENHVQIDRRGRIVSNTAVVIKNNADGLPIEKETVVSNPSGVAVAHSVEKNQYKDGTLSAKTQVNSDQNGTTTTSKTYAEDGRTVLNVIQDVKNKDGTTGHTEQKHNKNGKLLEKHTISRDANGKIVDDLTSKAEYINDGNIIQKWTVKGTKNGYPHDSVTKYDENGKMQTIDSTFYVRGGKVEEHYEGANLENRNCFIPSKQITYEEDGKTIKNVTVNKFDKDGVLIGSEIQDKDGKVIESHDFSKIDGKFDTSSGAKV